MGLELHGVRADYRWAKLGYRGVRVDEREVRIGEREVTVRKRRVSFDINIRSSYEWDKKRLVRVHIMLSWGLIRIAQDWARIALSEYY